MPARLTFAFRLGSLILLAVSLTAPTWATEAADVERAAKRLRAQTYRQYRYDRREYDRRMEPVDRALAEWRAQGSPAGEADRLVDWIGTLERGLGGSANGGRAQAGGRPHASVPVEPRMPPRSSLSADQPKEAADPARSSLPRQRRSAPANAARPPRVAQPLATTPPTPELQIAPSSSALERTVPPTPPLDRAPPSQRTRVPRSTRAPAGAPTTRHTPPLPAYRALGAAEPGSRPAIDPPAPPSPAASRHPSAPPLAFAGAAPEAFAPSAEARLQGSATAASTRLLAPLVAPQTAARSLLRRPKPTTPQRLPAPTLTTRDQDHSREHLPTHRQDPRTQPPAQSLAAAPRRIRKQPHATPLPFSAPARVATFALRSESLPNGSAMSITIEAAAPHALRTSSASPALRRLTPASPPLPRSSLARQARGRQAGDTPPPRAAGLVAALPDAASLTNPASPLSLPARRSLLATDPASWPIATLARPLPSSLPSVASLEPAAAPPQVQPSTSPITRVATVTITSTSRALALPDDPRAADFATPRRHAPLLLPRRESSGAAFPTNVPGSPRSMLAPVSRPTSRPRALLASTTVAVPTLPTPATPAADLLNVPVLTARIRSYNLSRAAVEDQLLAAPEWNLDRMEEIVEACSQLQRQYRFLRLYYDASRETQPASTDAVAHEEPEPVDSLLKLVEDRCAARSSQLVVLDEVLEDEATREERQRLAVLARQIQSWMVAD